MRNQDACSYNSFAVLSVTVCDSTHTCRSIRAPVFATHLNTLEAAMNKLPLEDRGRELGLQAVAIGRGQLEHISDLRKQVKSSDQTVNALEARARARGGARRTANLAMCVAAMLLPGNIAWLAVMLRRKA